MGNQYQVPMIYNLFPRLAGTMSDWLKHASRAAEMGFNWLYINSMLYPGFSGSLYAIKDYYRIGPEFLPRGTETDGMDLLAETLRRFRGLGLWPMMDLVINHTARDCPLTGEHPAWYAHDEHGEIVSPFARDPDDPQKVTVWGDLAEVDNQSSTDREALWEYWGELVKRYLRLGFKGFRCDAAYKVPAALWRYLVEQASDVDREAMFFAETLGSAEEEALALHSAGLHYFFNSSKWWDFVEPWCLEQHETFGRIVPSISFPETHDTTRLAADTNGNEAIQRQRYAFAASFSAGVMMPIGYEFGFRKKLDVVSTRPSDWEEFSFDLRRFIGRMNKLKTETTLLHGEGELTEVVKTEGALVLERQSEQAPEQKGFIFINKNRNGRTVLSLDRIAVTSRHRLHRICRNDDYVPEPVAAGQSIELAPSELILLLES
jgi:starch synthase (maltosyl-transferring)